MSSPLLVLSNDTGSQCYQRQGFGPVVWNTLCADGRDGFDFTLPFEQSILSIGPSALLLLALPLRCLYLRSQPRKTKPVEYLGFSKVVSVFLPPCFFSVPSHLATKVPGGYD
jgi:ATP-binding cassette subfamily C (CFTR/MRP) protein 1